MKRTAPVWTMRPRLIKVHGENVPGPGSYSPTNSTMPSSPNYRVGTAQRKELNKSSLTPGPGSYTVIRSGDTPSWSFYGKSTRLLSNSKASMPSHGTFKFNMDSDSPKYSLGKSLRKSFEINPNIAGTNHPSAQSIRGSSLFGKTNKNYFTLQSTGPGPGDYEIHPLRDAPAFTFRPKISIKGKEKVPGPGEYNPKFEAVREKSPSWIVRGRDEGNRSIGVPGPGTYEVPADFSGPRWKFGNAKRKETKIENPGPGTYEIKPLIGAMPSYVQTN